MISILTQRAAKLMAIQTIKLRHNLGIQPGVRDIYYFGYGANLDTKRFEKYAMNVESVGVAKLADFKLSFSLPCEYIGKGYASADPKIGEEIWGYLYKMDRLSMLLLDIMEWALFNQYRKIEVSVNTNDGTAFRSVTYQSRHPKEGLIPSNQYKKAILSSAQKHGFPKEYLALIESTNSKEKFELDPGYSLMFPNKRRLLEKQLRRLYLTHDKLREQVCDWLSF